MDQRDYEVVVVGDGPAGATTALYTTRLGHETAVVDRGGGRHTAVVHVHNLQGVSEDVSGKLLNQQAKEQLATYGADYYTDDVRTIERDGDGDGDGDDGRFRIHCEHHDLTAERVVLATGFRDVPPSIHGLTRFTGRGLHYCLHCDAYQLIDEPTYVLGCDDHAATVAMIMLNFTADVDLLLDGDEPEWSESVETQLRAHPVEIVESEVVEPYAANPTADHPRLGGFQFADGSRREYRGGFAMYGSSYNAGLAGDLGCELADDGSIEVDADGHTSVDGVYAVGDVTHGQNQTAIAIGNGARAGIALHKELRRFPLSPEEIEERGPPGDREVPAAPEQVRERAAAVRAAANHPGLVPPGWNREG